MGRFRTRDSSQKWLKFEVYSPLIWGAKREIFIPVRFVNLTSKLSKKYVKWLNLDCYQAVIRQSFEIQNSLNQSGEQYLSLFMYLCLKIFRMRRKMVLRSKMRKVKVKLAKKEFLHQRISRTMKTWTRIKKRIDF